MSWPRGASLTVLVLMLFMLGCEVHSKYQTRSFLTEEERQAIDEMYHRAQPDSEDGEDQVADPFLENVEGTALTVNGWEVSAADIRNLYEYLASFMVSDTSFLKQLACEEWIRAAAAITHWPDTVDTTLTRLQEIKYQVNQGADFGYLIVENSQEPGADQTAGDLGEVLRGSGLNRIFEMHAFTEPVGEIVGPFPTIFGWHLLEVIDRNTDNPDEPIVHCRHLLLFHGLDPENGELIRSDVERWRDQATVEILVDELNAVLPWFVPREMPEIEGIPANEPVSD